MKTFTMGVLGVFRPDMMQAVNGVLVLMLIPLFQSFVYPALVRFKIPHTPLQKMGAGLLFCGVSFIASGYDVTTAIMTSLPPLL